MGIVGGIFAFAFVFVASSDGLTLKSGLISQHPAAVITSPKFENTLYVDGKNGLDTNDGLSEATALKTLKGTKEHLGSGTQILVMDGTYRTGIFSLKHESSILRSFIQPCMRFWKCQASSPWDKQYRA